MGLIILLKFFDFHFERLIIVAHHLATASPPLPLLDHLCLRE